MVQERINWSKKIVRNDCARVKAERSISVVMDDESIQRFVRFIEKGGISFGKEKRYPNIRSSVAEYLTYVASVGD